MLDHNRDTGKKMIATVYCVSWVNENKMLIFLENAYWRGCFGGEGGLVCSLQWACRVKYRGMSICRPDLLCSDVLISKLYRFKCRIINLVWKTYSIIILIKNWEILVLCTISSPPIIIENQITIYKKKNLGQLISNITRKLQLMPSQLKEIKIVTSFSAYFWQTYQKNSRVIP